ncbi:MAG: hypothetical protein V4695_00165 [Pseudomonadota bacterium]
MNNSIDLNSPPPDHNYSIKVDPKETDGDRAVRLFKDVALFLVAVGFVVLLAVLCYSTLSSATASPDEKKWAMSIISGAAGGIIGYLVRK